MAIYNEYRFRMKEKEDEENLPRYMVSKFRKHDPETGEDVDLAVHYDSSGSDFSVTPEEIEEYHD